MNYFQIIKKKFLIKKSFNIYLILVLIFSFNTISGCLENNNKKEEYNSLNLSKNDVNKSLNLAIEWLVSNTNKNGISNYIYDYKKDLYLNEDNIIHQLKVIKFLGELSHQNNTINELHRNNMDYVINNIYSEKYDMGFIIYENKSDIISNSIFLRTILLSPFLNEYQSYSYKIANTIISLQNKNGSFRYDLYLEFIDNETNLSYYHSEEIILSLIDMYLFTNNNTYLNSAILSEDYFIDKFLINLSENYLSYMSGHLKSIKKLYDITKDEKYIYFLLKLNDKLMKYQETKNISKIGYFSDLEFDNKYFTNSSLNAYIINSILDLYSLSLNNSNDYNQKYNISLILGIYNLIDLQYIDINEKINGAIRNNYDNHIIRIDSTLNTIETLWNFLKIFDKNENWNYSYYPKLDLLIENNQDYTLEDNSIWYALFIGTIFSIITIVLIYITIKIFYRKNNF